MLITQEQLAELDDEETNADLVMRHELSAMVRKNYLDPVLSDLRERMSSDAKVLPLLDNIRLKIRSRLENDPQSIAYREGEYNVIDISISDISKAGYIAEVAAAFDVITDEKIAEQIGFQLGKQQGEAKSKGEKPPWPKIDCSQLGLHADSLETIKKREGEILHHYIAWIVLHEIGHHQLCHFNSETLSQETLSQARQHELDADLWAFKKMNDMDYAMCLLVNCMLGLTVVELLQGNLGIGLAETESNHPKWASRGELLANFIIDSEPPYSKWIWFTSSLLEKTSECHRFGMLDITIPTDPVEIGSGLSFVNNSLFDDMSIMAVEYKDDGAYLYNHVLEPRVTIHIITPFAHRSDADWYEYSGGSSVKTPFKLYRHSDAFIRNVKKGQYLGKEYMQISTLETMIEVMNKVESRQSVRNSVENILRDCLEQQYNITVKFYKGSSNIEAYDAEWRKLGEEMSQRIKSEIGDEKHKKFQEELMKDKMVQLGINKAMQNYGIKLVQE